MDLWTDLDRHDNKHQLPYTMGRERTRRLTEHVVFALVREWLLSDYVSAYCRSLATTRIFRRCYWIDALGVNTKITAAEQVASSFPIENQTPARKSRKKDIATTTSPIPPLSPLLYPLFTLSQTLAQEAKPITLYGFALEQGSSKTGKRKNAKMNGATSTTEAAQKTLLLPKEGGVIPSNWLEAAPLLLAESMQAPAIFLLNPFGRSLFSSEDLAQLYQRTMPTEVCLLLSHKQVETHLLSALRTPATAVTLTGVLRTDRWKTLSIQEDEREQSIRAVIDLFAQAIQRHFQLPVQQIVLPVQTRPAMVEELPYTLLFATRRQDSFVAMNDAFCLYRHRIHKQSHRGILAEEWFSAQLQEHAEKDQHRLRQHILQQGRNQRIRRWPDLRQQVLLANFGQFLLHDYDIILHQLLQSGEVRCEWRLTQSVHEGEQRDRLPGNDDILLW